MLQDFFSELKWSISRENEDKSNRTFIRLCLAFSVILFIVTLVTFCTGLFGHIVGVLKITAIAAFPIALVIIIALWAYLWKHTGY